MVIYHTNLRLFARFVAMVVLCLSVSCQGFSHEEEEEEHEQMNNAILTEFEVDGGTLHMEGAINRQTPVQLKKILTANPGIKLIVMHEVPGSIDDVFLFVAARMVRNRGIATHLPADAEIASGGVDFFLAGTKRTAESGAKIGVHSWDDSDYEGRELDSDAPEHLIYLEYYRDMGIAEDFYRFTLNAADADDIHWMTKAEMKRYKMLTQ